MQDRQGRGDRVTDVVSPAQAQEQIDQMMAGLQAHTARIREQQSSAMSATGSARSQDGTVHAVVDATGVLTSLTIEPNAFDRTTPDKLARTVVATAQAAAAKARGQLAEGLEEMRGGENPGLATAMAIGGQRLNLPRVGVPEVPRTEVDPTSDEADQWSTEPAAPRREFGAPEEADEPVEAAAPEPTPAPQPIARPAVARQRPVDEEELTGDERPW